MDSEIKAQLIALGEENVAAQRANQKTLDNLQARIDELEAKGNRMGGASGFQVSGSPIYTRAQEDHFKAFDMWARKGAGEPELRGMEINAAMSDGSNPDGGYAVPEQIDRAIDKIIYNAVAMRRLANVITAGVGYVKLFNMNNTASGWVGETDPRPNTGTPNLAKLTPWFGTLYANPAATQNALDDVFFDLESYLIENISEQFTWQEGAAFLSGNGTNMPKGLLTFPMAETVDGVRAFGTLQYVISGDANAFPAVTATFSPHDVLLNLIGAVKAAYRQNASFLMNKNTLTYLRQIKTAMTGEYLIQPATATAAASIWGYPIEEDENMPNIGAGSVPILFGDFKKAYTIVDVKGTRVLRDPFTNKPYVSWYTTKRMGGFLSNSEAVKALKISAT